MATSSRSSARLSECGSHNGPTGFHIHQILTSDNTDCLFTPEEVAPAPQLVGYAFDGYPIYTGIDQYTSSWELTDESLFATDTWAAHPTSRTRRPRPVQRTHRRRRQLRLLHDRDFPYVIGCYAGVVDLRCRRGRWRTR